MTSIADNRILKPRKNKNSVTSDVYNLTFTRKENTHKQEKYQH